MSAQSNPSTFDSLVSGISSDERRVLLEKMKSGKSAEGIQLSSKENFDRTSGSANLDAKLSQESFLLKIWFWIKAFFKSTTIQDVYNSSLVSEIARNVDHKFPGIIDYRRQVLTRAFSEQLKELIQAQEVFKQSVTAYEKDPAAFYVVLGSIIVPQVGEEMDHDADPYTYSFLKEINSEMRTSLLRKMDDIMQRIPQNKKNEMYECVRSVEWLKQFVKLPLQNLLHKFTDLGGEAQTCSFDVCGSEINAMAKVFCNGRRVSDELIQALYIFNKKAEMQDVENFPVDEEHVNSTSFVDLAAQQFTVIGTFINAVPMRGVSCVVNNNALYVPEAIGGGEDWFVKYKGQWKVLFDKKWENWLRDNKTEKVKVKLNEYFGVGDIPKFPCRPWTQLWGGITFRYDMTLGFINSFIREISIPFFKTLKTVEVEGDFVVKENRPEFSDTINAFSDISNAVTELIRKFSEEGEYGSVILKYAHAKGKTQNGVKNVEVVMNEAERIASGLIVSFGEASRNMIKFLNGLTSDYVISGYGGLTNIGQISAKNGKTFKHDLMTAKLGIQHGLEILQDIEPLDKPVA